MQRLAFDRSAIAMQQTGIQQQLHHLRDATGLVQINGHIATTGFEIADHRNSLADALEVIDAQLHPRSAGNGQEVQDGVGGAAHGHDHADGVLKGFPGQQIPGANVGLDGVDKNLSTARCAVRFFGIFGRHR